MFFKKFSILWFRTPKKMQSCVSLHTRISKADMKSGLAGQHLADSAAMLSLDGVVLPLPKWI